MIKRLVGVALLVLVVLSVTSLNASIHKIIYKSRCGNADGMSCGDCRLCMYPTGSCPWPEFGCFATQCTPDTAMNFRMCLVSTTECHQKSQNISLLCGGPGGGCNDWYCGCTVSSKCNNGCRCDPTIIPITYTSWQTWPVCDN